MGIKVVVGEAKSYSNLTRKLAMVYVLLLRRAAEAEAETSHGPGEACSPGGSLAATPGGASESQTLTTK